MLQLTKEDFPLLILRAKLIEIGKEVNSGRGFKLIRYGALCCAVLCCAVLCCAVLCCAVLCCAVPCLLAIAGAGSWW